MKRVMNLRLVLKVAAMVVLGVIAIVLYADLQSIHQIYRITPAQVISDFRTAVDSFVERLRSNEGFKDAIFAHPWIATPNEHTEEILEAPEYLSSMVVFLHATGREIQHAVLKTLGLSHKQVPVLELEWLEVLLSHCLYSDVESFQPSEQILKLLRRELLEIGAIERRRVKLRDPSDHLMLLTTSITN